MPALDITVPRLRLLSGFAGAAFLIAVYSGVADLQPAAEAQESEKPTQDSTPSAELKPVEADPHHFMEYINQPTFLRLKQAMRSEPNDEKGWKSITSDALILAEAGNLLLMRPPQEEAADWSRHAIAVRQTGSEIYHAAEKKEFATARTAYESLVSQCNDCHDHFNDGKPNLKP